MSTIIDRILAEVCLDERIPDGVFDMSNNTHMEVLRESLADNFSMPTEDIRMIHNKMVEGKYPERQAYNKDGLLVTFPTPQHKQRAIQRGTHFEQDPTKGANGGSNVFGGQQGGQQGGQAPAPAPAAPQGGGGEKEPAPAPEGGQNVFPQGQEQPTKEPAPAPAPKAPAAPAGGQAGSALPPSDSQPSAPAPSAAPQGQSAPSSLPASDQPVPGGGTLAVEPAPGENKPEPPPNFETPKTPEQRAAEATAVKQIMRGDDNNPTIAERRLTELYKVLNFAKQMGLNEAVRVISEAMVK